MSRTDAPGFRHDDGNANFVRQDHDRGVRTVAIRIILSIRIWLDGASRGIGYRRREWKSAQHRWSFRAD
jgi:hypothetical protein